MPRLQSDFDQPARAARLGVMLARGERVTSAVIRKMFCVSKATAKRDLLMLEASLPVQAEVTARNQVILSLPKGNSVARITTHNALVNRRRST